MCLYLEIVYIQKNPMYNKCKEYLMDNMLTIKLNGKLLLYTIICFRKYPSIIEYFCDRNCTPAESFNWLWELFFNMSLWIKSFIKLLLLQEMNISNNLKVSDCEWTHKKQNQTVTERPILNAHQVLLQYSLTRYIGNFFIKCYITFTIKPYYKIVSIKQI